MIIFKELSLFRRSHTRELAEEVIARSRQILSGMMGFAIWEISSADFGGGADDSLA